MEGTLRSTLLASLVQSSWLQPPIIPPLVATRVDAKNWLSYHYNYCQAIALELHALLEASHAVPRQVRTVGRRVPRTT